jgi:hypothetical protein
MAVLNDIIAVSVPGNVYDIDATPHPTNAPIYDICDALFIIVENICLVFETLLIYPELK